MIFCYLWATVGVGKEAEEGEGMMECLAFSFDPFYPQCTEITSNIGRPTEPLFERVVGRVGALGLEHMNAQGWTV